MGYNPEIQHYLNPDIIKLNEDFPLLDPHKTVQIFNSINGINSFTSKVVLKLNIPDIPGFRFRCRFLSSQTHSR